MRSGKIRSGRRMSIVVWIEGTIGASMLPSERITSRKLKDVKLVQEHGCFLSMCN
jgi:hypothetical protein